MDLKLKGKSVIVTAASKGLGKAVAMEFAKNGANVLISSRDEEALKKTKAEIIQNSGQKSVDYIVCDMKNPEQIKQMVQQAVTLYGTVDVLINNAGGPPAGLFEEMTDDDWYHAFELNLLSFVRTIREVLPFMKKQQSGRIVNLSSSSIKESIDQLLLSNTMRPGVLGLTKSLSQEFGPHQILINTVGPGTIMTDRIIELNEMNAESRGVPVEQVIKEKESAIPFQRFGKPEEFAKAVVFLASGANTYITGQSLIVDGGMVKGL
ncbi:MAG TPA: SDR family oxidoreductase [Cerasibacillus sp.]|uniref:SDR family oxidoreductase n=1 Tax=Cerasibacillus sp. TaxID=2498711 RepID=UPI002F3FBD3B